MTTVIRHSATEKLGWHQRVPIPDSIQSQQSARCAVGDCTRHCPIGEAAELRAMLIAAGLAADIHHARAGQGELEVRWCERRRHPGVLSLTLDKPATPEWSMPELTELTLELLSTRWACLRGPHVCRIIAHVEDHDA
jgi:hypothetical protein